MKKALKLRFVCYAVLALFLVAPSVNASPMREDPQYLILLLEISTGDRETTDLLELRLQIYRRVYEYFEDTWLRGPEALSAEISPMLIQTRHHLAETLQALDRKQEALAELDEAEKLLFLFFRYNRCDLHSSEYCSSLESALIEHEIHSSRILEGLGEAQASDEAIVQAILLLPEEDAAAVLRSAIAERVSHQSFEDALAITFELIDNAASQSKSSLLAESGRLAMGVANEIFYSISWDPQTEQIRDDDPNDFTGGITVELGKNSKYGMRNRFEDRASYVGMAFSYDAKAEKGDPERNLPAYVRNQMSQGNFEPAAKYLFAHTLNRFPTTEQPWIKCPPTLSEAVTFDEVTAAIETSKGSIAPVTIQSVRLFQAIDEFVRKRCRDGLLKERPYDPK